MWAVIADGAGGWYIGGEFTRVSGLARGYLAHIGSDRSVDSTFDAAANGPVFALKLSGGSLYVGGAFTSIGGQQRGSTSVA